MSSPLDHDDDARDHKRDPSARTLLKIVPRDIQ